MNTRVAVAFLALCLVWHRYVHLNKHGFTAVIFADVRNRFPMDPTKEYWNKVIRVTGRIKMYEGHPEIIAESPSQIQVVH